MFIKCMHVFIVIIITFRVCDYIKYGWDLYLIDPDNGVNVQNKLQAIAEKCRNPIDEVLLQSIPKAKILNGLKIYTNALKLHLVQSSNF